MHIHMRPCAAVRSGEDDESVNDLFHPPADGAQAADEDDRLSSVAGVDQDNLQPLMKGQEVLHQGRAVLVGFAQVVHVVSKLGDCQQPRHLCRECAIVAAEADFGVRGAAVGVDSSLVVGNAPIQRRKRTRRAGMCPPGRFRRRQSGCSREGCRSGWWAGRGSRLQPRRESRLQPRRWALRGQRRPREQPIRSSAPAQRSVPPAQRSVPLVWRAAPGYR